VFRFVEGKEAHVTDFILMKKLCVRPGLDGSIYTSEAFKKDHGVSLRINKAQKDSVPFQEVSISKWCR
jgi:hypothetical protein